MSIEREESLTRFTCNGDPRGNGSRCPANYEGVDGFSSAWTEAKCHGWVSFNNGKVWLHYCPKCKKELGDD